MNNNTELKSLNKEFYPEPKQVTPYVTLEGFGHFEQLVLDWARERNLLEGTTNLLQCKKLYEESHELLCNYLDGNDMEDDIGDILVLLVQMFYRADIECFVRDIKSALESGLRSEVGEFFSSVGDLINTTTTNYIDKEWFGEEDDYEWFERVLNELVFFVNTTDLDLLECCEVAYNDIRDRKGKMINGSFVKEV